jgi:asparagine synthase (glutamine-hydrolysing)
MRRLAIIDLRGGAQPIANETGEIQVVFNGEIYNYETLRRDLHARGHILATHSDTETITHLYEEFGLSFVHHLRGMFAIALWDSPRRRLILVRDRIGEKPLYYRIDGERLYFGSEIKAILRAGAGRAIDPQAICDFLAMGYVPAPATCYVGVRKLEPGHMLVHEGRQARVDRYWTPPQRPSNAPPYEQALEALAVRLHEATALCLKSDVEVGAFLSGGIDSSVLVALMRQHSARVKTFSVGYRGAAEGFNELHYARVVAERLRTDHHEVILDARSSIDLLPRILSHYDEPHGEPTSVLVYLLCEATARHVKVAIAGTGADEIFFGYPRHRALPVLHAYQVLPRLLRRQLIERVIARWPESTRGSRFAKRAHRFITGSDLPPAEAYLTWVSLLHRDVRMPLLGEQLRAAEDPTGEQMLRNYLLGTPSQPLLTRAALLDVAGYLPEFQLAYIDRMSMAHGLEVRSPYCDAELVADILRLPDRYRLHSGRSKRLLKDVATRWIPREIAERRKVGFDSPIGQWFKDELRPFLKSFLSPEQVQRSGLLDPGAVQRLVGAHISGRCDHSLQLWSLIALEAWYRMYIEDKVTEASTYSLADMRGACDQT